MAVTYTTQATAGLVIVAVTSDLGPGVVFHWYADGEYLGGGPETSRAIGIAAGEQATIEVIDTLDAEFDPVANAPAGWPARRTLCWVRSLDGATVSYRVRQQRGADPWTLIGLVPHDRTQWSYRFRTPRLDDLTQYTWRIVPVDAAGNEGAVLTIGPELIVRTPDAPRFAIEFDPLTDEVTIEAA